MISSKEFPCFTFVAGEERAGLVASICTFSGEVYSLTVVEPDIVVL